MAFDFKKEFKEFYLPKSTPQIVTVPPMQFITADGQGNPNDPTGEYKQAIELLYAVAYTIKMSKKGTHQIESYFDFAVPPLEGFWEQEGLNGFDLNRKDQFIWTSVIRMPDFVTQDEPEWAVQEVAGYENDFSPTRRHHEIYLSDMRRTAPEKLKTVIRHPVKKRVTE